MERVLIVEDDENIRQLLKLTLASFNYELIDFENGKDAYDYLQDNKVDLAILDLMLPGMSGYDMCVPAASIQPTGRRDTA